MSYYYSILTNQNKQTYDLMFDGINNYDKRITVPYASRKSLLTVFNSVIYDNPILFYTRAFRYMTAPVDSRSVLMPVYKYDEDFTNKSADVIDDYMHTFDTVRNESDIEKELFVHDHCLDRFTYDHQFNEHAFSILGPVVFNTGVCEGISKFVKVALNYLGVECIVVAGKGYNPLRGRGMVEPHMWNIVRVNGKTYHLDVTYNLTQKDTVNRYDYFNLSDTEIKKDHSFTGLLPVCDTSINY